MRPKRLKGKKIMYINRRNNNVENKTEILYNTMHCRTMEGMWRSLVAHLFWVQNVTGSNPVIPSHYCSK